MTLMPYEMRRKDFIPLYKTYPVPNYPVSFVKEASEAELHRVTLLNRQRETKAPNVPRFELGSWAIGQYDSLYQLREINIHEIITSDSPNPKTIQKYIQWYLAGSDFPAVYLVENIRQRNSLTDGHHRLTAQKELGLGKVLAWVNPGLLRYLPNQSQWMDDATYPAITVLALRFGIKVKNEVLQDALQDYLNGLQIIAENKNPIRLKGHEGIISATDIETLRNWQILTAPYQNSHYEVSISPLGRTILDMLSLPTMIASS